MKNSAKYLTKTPVVFAAALICNLLWGSAFSVIKIGYKMFEIAEGDSFAQLLFAGCRFTLSGLLAIVPLCVRERKIILPRHSDMPSIVKLGLVQTVAQYLFFYIGLARTTGIKASIIDASNVFIAILMSCFVFRTEKLTVRKVICCVLGFGGVILINLTGRGAEFGFDMTLGGEGALLASAVAYALSSNLIKRYSKTADPVMLSGCQFVFGGLALIAVGLLGGGRITVSSPAALAVLLYLSILSATAYSLWGILLKYNPVGKVVIYGFLSPIFGVLLSAALLGEGRTLGLRGVLALALVSVGIFLGNINNEKTHKNL